MGLVVFLAPLAIAYAIAYSAFLCLFFPAAVADEIIENFKEKFNALFKDKTDINLFN